MNLLHICCPGDRDYGYSSWQDGTQSWHSVETMRAAWQSGNLSRCPFLTAVNGWHIYVNSNIIYKYLYMIRIKYYIVKKDVYINELPAALCAKSKR